MNIGVLAVYLLVSWPPAECPVKIISSIELYALIIDKISMHTEKLGYDASSWEGQIAEFAFFGKQLAWKTFLSNCNQLQTCL